MRISGINKALETPIQPASSTQSATQTTASTSSTPTDAASVSISPEALAAYYSTAQAA